MRIISGKFKGKKLSAPNNLPVRPTTDYAKESLFNIINNHYFFEDLAILDGFSGTGNIGYEFISRGAGKVDSVDANTHCIKYQNEIKTALGLNNLYTIQQDFFEFLKTCTNKYDLIFCDPPYDIDGINNIPNLVFENNLLTEDAWLIIEHSKNTLFNHPNYLETRKYGTVNFSFFK